MKFSIFVTPAIPGTFEERKAKRPIGRDNEAFQRMVDDLRSIAVTMDQSGFEALTMSEHHFHSEGLEASVAPMLLYADLAARTERLKFGTLGLVLPTWDPIRAAEEVAVLDHLLRGRLYVGVARGYQSRWAGVLGQHFDVSAATSDSSDSDVKNQEVFEEVLKIMKMAWTQDTVRYRSELLDYNIPNPYEGVAWPPAQWTEEYGAPGEMGEDGLLKAVCVIPKPYQTPHPPLWQPFALSDRTMRRCARMGILPWVFAPQPELAHARALAFQEEAAKHGRNLALGEDTGTLRFVSIDEDADKAWALGEQYIPHEFNRFHGTGFGYREALRLPGDDEKFPGPLPESEGNYKRLVDVKLTLSGKPDDIKREIEEIIKVANPEWFGWQLMQQASMPIDQLLHQIELFGEHIIPEFSD